MLDFSSGKILPEILESSFVKRVFSDSNHKPPAEYLYAQKNCFAIGVRLGLFTRPVNHVGSTSRLPKIIKYITAY